ncbi:MAG: hypothetical protein QOI56_315 [Actinomycetota bacterium]|nr:hypothetical protein [Actinomycetota bacterium]
MAAPEHVPVRLADKARAGTPIPPARAWKAVRPGDLVGRQPGGRDLGRQGPDQGYALLLARRFADRLQLAPGEHTDDAVAGAMAVAMARASLFGRAPVIHDLDLAFTLWGYLGDAPPELVAYRAPLFSGASHHYWDQRHIVDKVPEATLRMTPAQVRPKLSDWRSLLNA